MNNFPGVFSQGETSVVFPIFFPDVPFGKPGKANEQTDGHLIILLVVNLVE
jgi:hypothetical protein